MFTAAFLELTEANSTGASGPRTLYVRMDLIAAVRPRIVGGASEDGAVVLLIPAGRELRVLESAEEVLGRIEEAAAALQE